MSVTDFKNSFVRGTDAVDYNAKISKAEHLEAEMDEISEQMEACEDKWERHEMEMAKDLIMGQLAGVLYEIRLLTETDEEARERGMWEDRVAEQERVDW